MCPPNEVEVCSFKHKNGETSQMEFRESDQLIVPLEQGNALLREGAES